MVAELVPYFDGMQQGQGYDTGSLGHETFSGKTTDDEYDLGMIPTFKSCVLPKLYL